MHVHTTGYIFRYTKETSKHAIMNIKPPTTKSDVHPGLKITFININFIMYITYYKKHILLMLQNQQFIDVQKENFNSSLVPQLLEL